MFKPGDKVKSIARLINEGDWGCEKICEVESVFLTKGGEQMIFVKFPGSSTHQLKKAALCIKIEEDD